MPAGEPTRFAWEDTPDPRRLAFSITVPDGLLDPTKVLAFVPYTSTYADMGAVLRAQDVRGDLRNYKYSLSVKGQGGTRIFYFIPPFTDDQRNTPFDTYTTTDPHRWDAKLEQLAFGFDFSVMQNSVRGGTNQEVPTIVSQIKFTDAFDEDALFTVRRYLSDTPWPESAIRHEKPVPTGVYWQFQGQNIGSFPACLHKAVRAQIDEYNQNFIPILNAGMIDELGGMQWDNDMVIPATNFTDWTDHIVRDSVRPVPPGLYYREQWEVHAPAFNPSLTKSLFG